jgi:chemotaxis protein histidine kinase CheA
MNVARALRLNHANFRLQPGSARNLVSGSRSKQSPSTERPRAGPQVTEWPTDFLKALKADQAAAEARSQAAEARSKADQAAAEERSKAAQAAAEERSQAVLKALKAEQTAAEARSKAEQTAAEARSKADQTAADSRSQAAEARSKADQAAAEERPKAAQAAAEERSQAVLKALKAEQAAAEARSKAEQTAAEARSKAEQTAAEKRLKDFLRMNNYKMTGMMTSALVILGGIVGGIVFKVFEGAGGTVQFHSTPTAHPQTPTAQIQSKAPTDIKSEQTTNNWFMSWFQATNAQKTDTPDDAKT